MYPECCRGTVTSDESDHVFHQKMVTVVARGSRVRLDILRLGQQWNRGVQGMRSLYSRLSRVPSFRVRDTNMPRRVLRWTSGPHSIASLSLGRDG